MWISVTPMFIVITPRHAISWFSNIGRTPCIQCSNVQTYWPSNCFEEIFVTHPLPTKQSSCRHKFWGCLCITCRWVLFIRNVNRFIASSYLWHSRSFLLLVLLRILSIDGNSVLPELISYGRWQCILIIHMARK